MADLMETAKTCAAVAGPVAAAVTYLVSKSQIDTASQKTDANFKGMQTWAAGNFKTFTEEITVIKDELKSVRSDMTAMKRKVDVFISEIKKLRDTIKPSSKPRKIEKRIEEDDFFSTPISVVAATSSRSVPSKSKSVSFVEEVDDFLDHSGGNRSSVKLPDEEDDDGLYDISELEDDEVEAKTEDDDGLEDALNTINSYSKRN